jgi:hypothetical protein
MSLLKAKILEDYELLIASLGSKSDIEVEYTGKPVEDFKNNDDTKILLIHYANEACLRTFFTALKLYRERIGFDENDDSLRFNVISIIISRFKMKLSKSKLEILVQIYKEISDTVFARRTEELLGNIKANI